MGWANENSGSKTKYAVQVPVRIRLGVMEISSVIEANQQKEILRQFLRDVWSEGNIEVANKFVAPRYIIHHDPGDL